MGFIWPASLPSLVTVHVQNDARSGVGGHLHVVSGAETAIAHLHVAGLWIRGGGAGVDAVAFLAFLPLLGHLRGGFDGLVHALQSFAGRAFAGLLLTQRLTGGVGFRRAFEFFQIGAGFALGLFERRLATERTAAGVGAHAHAILGGGSERDESLGEQARQRIDLQLLEQVARLDAEVGEHVIVDGDVATQPFVGAMFEAEPFEFAGAADAIGGRIEPEGEQDLRIAGVASGRACDGVNVLVEAGEVEALDELPNDASGGIGVQALVERFAVHLALEALRLVKAWRGGRVRTRCSRRGRSRERVDFRFREEHGLAIALHKAPSSTERKGSMLLPIAPFGLVG